MTSSPSAAKWLFLLTLLCVPTTALAVDYSGDTVVGDEAEEQMDFDGYITRLILFACELL